MALVASLRRPIGLFMSATMLVACTAGGLVPPDEIDGQNTVNAIAPAAQVQMSNDASAYPSAGTPVASARQNAGSLGTSRLAEMPADDGTQTLGNAGAQASANGGQLPRIDSDEALGRTQQASMDAGSLEIPENGVNMDAALGVEPVHGLAQAQAEEIAEGNATAVTVDGIGTDNPQQVGEPVSVPMPEAGEEMGLSGEDAGRIVVPRKGSMAAPEEEQQVAFLPRLTNPMSVPETMGGMPASEKSCRQRLQRLGVQFRDVPPISKGRSCGIDHPIEVSGLSGGIQIKPAAKVNCQITEAFAKWVKNELAPSARYRYLSGVKAIHQLSSYSCRTMNSRAGAAMSEHAKGNAIDVGKIVLNNGKEIAVRRKGFFAFREKGLLKAVRADSCKYFTTVLGPGSDRYHKDHFHFDLRSRKSGYRHCSL